MCAGKNTVMYNKTSNPQARKWLMEALELKKGEIFSIICQDKKDRDRIYFLLASERRLLYTNDKFGVFKDVKFRFLRTGEKNGYPLVKIAKVSLDREVEVNGS